MARGDKYTINGETMTIPEFARKYHLTDSIIKNRLKHGVSDEKMLLSVEEYRRTRNFNKTSKQLADCCSWTPLALECYHAKNCEECSLPRDIKSRCRMKETLYKIIKRYGEPPGTDEQYAEQKRKELKMSDLKEKEISKYRERLKPYIEAVMAKYERKERRQAIYDKYMEKLGGAQNDR